MPQAWILLLKNKKRAVSSALFAYLLLSVFILLVTFTNKSKSSAFCLDLLNLIISKEKHPQRVLTLSISIF